MKHHPALPPLDAHQRYTTAEAADYLRCSRAHLYAQIADGHVHAIKEGRRTFIHGSELIRVSSQGAAWTPRPRAQQVPA